MPQFDLTPEQAQLILQIVSQLVSDYRESDENGKSVCKYCGIPLGGYQDHKDTCAVSLIWQLRETMKVEQTA